MVKKWLPLLTATSKELAIALLRRFPRKLLEIIKSLLGMSRCFKDGAFVVFENF
jgi:hypothetical protein